MEELTKLQDLISDNDDTQNSLADAIEVNRNQIRRWITGESEMGIWKLKKICQYYGVSADYILDLGKGMRHPR